MRRRGRAAGSAALLAYLLAAAVPMTAAPGPAERTATSGDPAERSSEVAPGVTQPAGEPFHPAGKKRPRNVPQRALAALAEEAARYGRDSLALAAAPLHWTRNDWSSAGGAGLLVGGVMLGDKRLDREAQARRSRFSNRVSAATTAIGGGYAVHISAALLAGGIAFREPALREMGRDALESVLFSSLLGKALKRGFGRERPGESDGETVFEPGSNHDSFPSGHATASFALASAVAARARGWVIPTVAYAAATLVAFDRVNDRVHFASDVVAGALLGAATGRFLVHRHQREESGAPPARFAMELHPIPGGIALKARF